MHMSGASSRESSICRLLRRHKWVRFQASAEEVYWCRRCGQQYVGNAADPDETEIRPPALSRVHVE